MNVFLWIVTILLAVAALGAGVTKVSQPYQKLRSGQMKWVEDFPAGVVKLIGALEILAAIGLILPPLVHLATIFVPLAATGFALIMIGAIITHVRRKENQPLPINVVLLVLALVVAWGRFGPYAF
jgi:uncharacterized membrane protein YphA (DoxX/SURF4 family)